MESSQQPRSGILSYSPRMGYLARVRPPSIFVLKEGSEEEKELCKNVKRVIEVRDEPDRKRVRIEGSFEKIIIYNNSIDVMYTGRSPEHLSHVLNKRQK